MITDFADFCLWMYVVVDTLYDALPASYKPSRGPQPRCSDSELLTLALVGECRGWHEETTMLANWHEHRDLFPHLPERSRFNRRRRQLSATLNAIRQGVLQMLELAEDSDCIIDSLPVPVVAFHLVPGAASRAEWQAAGADFGWIPSKKQHLFGYKLHLVVTLGGVIRDFVLAPASATDVTLAEELLRTQAGRRVVGDKAYVSAPLAEELAASQATILLAVPRRNQKQQRSPELRRLLSRVRQIIETVNSQLTLQFQIGHHRACSFWGLCARLYTKLTAHTLCIYLNYVLGNPEPLRIKELAFPNN